MSLYVCFSDLHLADRPPSSCTDTYTADLLAMLDEVSEIAERSEAAAIICAGDFFHHKAPSRTSHRLVQAAIRWVQAAPCAVLIVPGNHDLQNDRLESLEATQPLGVLYQAGAARLEGWGSPFKVFGVPWLGYCGDQDGEEAMDAQDEVVWDTLYEYRNAGIKPSEPYLVVTHAPLYPPGKELTYEYFRAERWAAAMGGYGSVFYGHVHEPHGEYGFYDASGGIGFCNNGALSRGSLHEYNLERTPGVTLWDDQTGKFRFVPLKCARPASEVFRLQEKQQVTDMQGSLDGFLSGVSATSLEVMNAETVIAHIKTLGIGKPAEDLAEELLTWAVLEGKK